MAPLHTTMVSLSCGLMLDKLDHPVRVITLLAKCHDSPSSVPVEPRIIRADECE